MDQLLYHLTKKPWINDSPVKKNNKQLMVSHAFQLVRADLVHPGYENAACSRESTEASGPRFIKRVRVFNPDTIAPVDSHMEQSSPDQFDTNLK